MRLTTRLYGTLKCRMNYFGFAKCCCKKISTLQLIRPLMVADLQILSLPCFKQLCTCTVQQFYEKHIQLSTYYQST